MRSSASRRGSRTAVLTGWGLNKLTGGALGSIVTELGKGLIKGVLGMTAGVVHIKAGTVTGAGGGVAPNRRRQGSAGRGGRREAAARRRRPRAWRQPSGRHRPDRSIP